MVLLPFLGAAQEEQSTGTFGVARNYYQAQEYDKAWAYLRELVDRSRNPQVYDLAFNCLLALEDEGQALDLAEAWARKMGGQAAKYEVDQYFLYLRLEKERKSERVLEDVLERVSLNPGLAYSYGKAFQDRAYFKEALQVYDQAIAASPNMNLAYQRALVYGDLGDITNMYKMYVEMVAKTPGYLPTVKMLLSRSIDPYAESDPNLEALKEELITQIQEGAPPRFNELLIYIFLQEKNFSAAYTQLRALDKRGKDQSPELLKLAKAAENAQENRIAQRTYQYLIDKGPESPYFQESVLGLLQVSKASLAAGASETKEWQKWLDQATEFRESFKGDPYQGQISLLLAEVYAYQMRLPDSAVSLWQEMFNTGYLGLDDIALAQIAYADYLIYAGQNWDAIIYYKKAEKALERSPIGQEAKFKRAKAAYYSGEFEWAQTIFKVLKESTSKIIANDAMRYNLLIRDNSALDSTYDALEAYAKADLLFYRQQYDSAQKTLSILEIGYAQHPIMDEAYYLQAQIAAKQNNWSQASAYYQRIIDEFPEDILVDDALFALAEIKEQEGDLEGARQYYQQLFTEQIDSFYAAPAREAYRRIRGDLIN